MADIIDKLQEPTNLSVIVLGVSMLIFGFFMKKKLIGMALIGGAVMAILLSVIRAGIPSTGNLPLSKKYRQRPTIPPIPATTQFRHATEAVTSGLKTGVSSVNRPSITSSFSSKGQPSIRWNPGSEGRFFSTT